MGISRRRRCRPREWPTTCAMFPMLDYVPIAFVTATGEKRPRLLQLAIQLHKQACASAPAISIASPPAIEANAAMRNNKQPKIFYATRDRRLPAHHRAVHQRARSLRRNVHPLFDEDSPRCLPFSEVAIKVLLRARGEGGARGARTTRPRRWPSARKLTRMRRPSSASRVASFRRARRGIYPSRESREGENPRLKRGTSESSCRTQSSGLISIPRKATGSLCPANPKCPRVRSLPGCGFLSMNSVTVLTSPSRIRVPFSSTRIVGPFTVTSMKFHSPDRPQVSLVGGDHSVDRAVRLLVEFRVLVRGVVEDLDLAHCLRRGLARCRAADRETVITARRQPVLESHHMIAILRLRQEVTPFPSCRRYPSTTSCRCALLRSNP